MAADSAALSTFLLLIFVGPVGYAVYYSVRCCLRGKSSSSTTEAAAAPASSRLNDYANGTPTEPAREQVRTAEYMLGLLGYAIGIGNLWRFPYLVGKYGGGAFVLAYLTCLFLVAMPMYQMEMVLGHHTRGSTIRCFNTIRPRWRSIGYAQALMLFYALAYYNVLIAYAAIYMIGSLVSPLPWSEEAVDAAAAAAANKSASEYYWSHEVLNEYGSLEGHGLGPVQPRLAGSLLCVWLVVFVSLVFGKQILAKITWVTVVGPVILLLVLLVQTTRLEGASDGVAYYIGKCEWALLLDAELWATACGQILFSLSPGMGTAITMSSYTAPKEDTYRVCIVVALANSAFSLTGGFAIFSILGNLAHRTGRSVADVASASGPGLAFVSIAEGVSTFGAGANAMAVLFFAMLVSLGLAPGSEQSSSSARRAPLGQARASRTGDPLPVAPRPLPPVAVPPRTWLPCVAACSRFGPPQASTRRSRGPRPSSATSTTSSSRSAGRAPSGSSSRRRRRCSSSSGCRSARAPASCCLT